MFSPSRTKSQLSAVSILLSSLSHPVYIDMDEGDDPLALDFRLPSSLQSRMWEMKIVQLDFEQRAPTDCLQYYQGVNGTLKTLNFLSNGRFLADQDYLVCIRQEKSMCGISYVPCSDDSFRIGQSRMQIANGTNSSTIYEGSSTNSTNVGSMNQTEPDVEGSGSDSAEEAGLSMNTTDPMDQDVASSTVEAYGQGRCRDRVLIPCDFEEFITVMFFTLLVGQFFFISLDRDIRWVGQIRSIDYVAEVFLLPDCAPGLGKLGTFLRGGLVFGLCLSAFCYLIAWQWRNILVHWYYFWGCRGTVWICLMGCCRLVIGF